MSEKEEAIQRLTACSWLCFTDATIKVQMAQQDMLQGGAYPLHGQSATHNLIFILLYRFI